jgi:dUTP pyrophosphatase
MQDAGKLGDVWKLPAGAYLVSFNETLTIPKDLVGFAWPRSTLLRIGASMQTAVFDAGYSGKPKCVLIIYNKNGATIHPNARLAQIVFMPLDGEVEKGYSGQYMNEGI